MGGDLPKSMSARWYVEAVAAHQPLTLLCFVRFFLLFSLYNNISIIIHIIINLNFYYIIIIYYCLSYDVMMIDENNKNIIIIIIR